MDIENTVTVDINFKPDEYVTKYNLILLENSKITTDKLMELLESFYNQTPKSFTFIFDFSKNVEDCLDYTPVMEYVVSVRECWQPEWALYTTQPIYLGNTDVPTNTIQRLNICSDIVYSFFGNWGICKIENVYCDMKENNEIR